jgi:AraC-like DNA-binding protein
MIIGSTEHVMILDSDNTMDAGVQRDASFQQVAEITSMSSIDEINEYAQNLGWNIDYQKMQRGPFAAFFTENIVNGITMTSEQFDSHLKIQCEPPEGQVGIFLPDVSGGCSLVCGQEQLDAELVFFPVGADMEVVTEGVLRNETIFLQRSDFLSIAASLVPALLPDLDDGQAKIIQGLGEEYMKIRAMVRQTIHEMNGDPEIHGRILARILVWMANAKSIDSEEVLSGAKIARIARSSADYINGHLREPIHMHDLCAATGVNLRTLQRSFTRYYQQSPTNYIKASRLNLAHIALRKADEHSQIVSAIALDCGFTHLGRFSVAYHGHFGESPSDTLGQTSVA